MKTTDFIKTFKLASLEGLENITLVVNNQSAFLQFDSSGEKLPLERFVKNSEIDHELVAAHQGNFEFSRVSSKLLGA